MLKTNYEKYMDLVYRGNVDEATDFRRSIMSKTIYKFYPILSDDGSHSDDQRTFATLKNNQIWCSKLSGFNDPFEGVGYYLNDLDEEMEHRWSECFRVACFTENAASNISMWAYYANNHKGFCVEYAVKNNQYLYDVNYIEFRESQVPIFMDAVHKKFLGQPTEKEEVLIFEKYLTKHVSWSNEKEYRIIYATEEFDEKGRLLSCNELGLEPRKVVAGIKCPDEIKKELSEISLHLGCGELKECRISNNKFKLI